MLVDLVKWAGEGRLATTSPNAIKLYLYLLYVALYNRSALAEEEYRKGKLVVTENLEDFAVRLGCLTSEISQYYMDLAAKGWSQIYKTSGVRFIQVGTVEDGKVALMIEEKPARKKTQRGTIDAIKESMELRKRQVLDRKKASLARFKTEEILGEQFELEIPKKKKSAQSTEVLEHFMKEYKLYYGEHAFPDAFSTRSKKWKRQVRVYTNTMVRILGGVDEAQSLITWCYRHVDSLKQHFRTDCTLEYHHLFASEKNVFRLKKWEKNNRIPKPRKKIGKQVTHRYDASDTQIPDHMKAE